MASTYHINPRIRAYGKARIDITQRARNLEEWQDGWHDSLHPFAFEFLDRWKFNVEYKVDDFAAEVGFFIDILGFTVIEFSPSHAQFTTPDQEFSFSVAAALDDEESTNPETLRIQLMVDEVKETCEELEQRGIIFEQRPQPLRDGSRLTVGYFRTPHGIPIDLWGYQVDVEDEETTDQNNGSEEFEMDLEEENAWQGLDEKDSEPTPSGDLLQTGELPPHDPPSNSIESDSEETDSLELVYEDEEDPDLVNKLIDSFDRFRSSRPLSRFSSNDKRENRSTNIKPNRFTNSSRYNNKGMNRGAQDIQDNL
jgi:catechol 2,3-dioxygenase-like lactoylglutathione lyase family enzyme